jgi:hypothetical protein
LIPVPNGLSPTAVRVESLYDDVSKVSVLSLDAESADSYTARIELTFKDKSVQKYKVSLTIKDGRIADSKSTKE